MDNCFCCGGKSFNFISYDNHLSTPKKSIRQLIRRILYLVIPKFFFQRMNNRLCNEALLGVWATNKIRVCDNCGAGQIKKIPHEKDMNLWFNTKGSLVKKGEAINFKKSCERSKSQFEYLSRYIKMDNIRHSLEYGAGTAVSSKIFKNKVKGIITTTVDISDRSNRFLKNAGYVDEVYDNLFDIKNQFDLIFCSHILPFVVDFQNVWTDLIGKLKKGGYIFIEQGNATKDYYMADTLDYPKLYLFSSKSLTELASNSDLNIVDISHVGHNWTDFAIHNKSKEYIKNDNGRFLRSILQKS